MAKKSILFKIGLSAVLLAIANLVGVSGIGQCTISFTGRVLDEDTRKPIANAYINLEGIQTTSTDSSGKFQMKGICPGNFNVVVSHVGCITQKRHVHFKDNVQQDFLLPHTANELSEVVVMGYGSVSKAAFTSQVSGKELDRASGLTLAETMRSVAGVSVLQTGTNIYKPVIHGLHSNRVIILNNGIRQEGQQWGSEHAPEVDPYIANRISVIKGASSLRYGSDAIGGVVLVEPRHLPAVPGTHAEVNMAAFSNNRQGVLSAMVEGAGSKQPGFSWRLQGTLKRGGNARTPNYWLANSGVTEYNFSAAAAYRRANKGIEVFLSQFNTSLGIFAGSHIGNVTDLQNAITEGQPPANIRNAGFTYSIDRPNQQIQHTLGKVKAFQNTGDIGRLNATVSVQHNKRKEYDLLRFANSNTLPQLDMDLVTVSTDVVWDHYAGEKWRGTVGVNAAYQRNLYFRRFFIPNYQAINAGAFVVEKYNTGKWLFEGGIRFDSRSIFNTDQNGGFEYKDKYFNSLSGNTGTTYKFNENWQTHLNVSTAWRAPQVNELYSDGLHHGAARIETGNAALKAERANSVMAGLNYNYKKLNIEAGIFYKHIDDFIYLRPSFPPQLTIRGAFPAFDYAQTNARLTGFDFSMLYYFNDHFSYRGKLALLRAWDKKANDWLVQMPADRFENHLEYTFSDTKKFKQNFISISVQSVLRQSRIPATGNIEITKPDGTISMEADYALPPDAYHLTGIEFGSTLQWKNQPIQIIAGSSNLFNVAYRDYLNAFRYFSDDMGRNIFLKLKLPFNL